MTDWGLTIINSPKAPIFAQVTKKAIIFGHDLTQKTCTGCTNCTAVYNQVKSIHKSH